jgi:hypothetical protein
VIDVFKKQKELIKKCVSLISPDQVIRNRRDTSRKPGNRGGRECDDLEAHSLKEDEEEKEEEHVLITFFGLVCWYSAGQHEEGNKYPNY